MDDAETKELMSKCKSIRISPSLDETLRDLGLSLELDANASLWLEQLKFTWKSWKKSTTLECHIDGFFRSRPDAFRIALIFIISCEEFKDCKPKSLPFFIIATLMNFSQATNLSADQSLKMPAFHIAIYQRNQHFLSLIVKTYQIAAIKESIIPLVNDMIKNDNCKQASQIVIAMEMFEDIPVEKLLFPLILQDKSNMIDDYLSECPSQVKPLLAFLDKLLDKNFKTVDFVQNYAEENNICQVKYDKLHYKPLGKLVARLCNKFNIPIETCKNLSKNRTTSGLRYLIYQKYMEHNVSSTVWEDLVKDSLRQNADSGLEFIDMLIDYDKYEALKWAKHLNLTESQLPLALQGSQDAQQVQQDTKEENWDTADVSPQDFYKSPLPREQIFIIDSGQKFHDLINSDLRNHPVVSLDCEWKPSFGAKQSQVAIIQIGTTDKVYLIDTILLNKQEYASLWYKFYKSFLGDAEIIKLGFGLEQDLREMKASIQGLGNIKVKGEGFLDLSILWKSLLNHKLCLPGSSDSGTSLSSVVLSCFGKPLEKAEQCSNWELRPLRETQIEYAALDAHVLIQIYYFLQRKCQEQGIDFEEICNDVMVESKKKVSKKPKVVDRLSFNQSFQTAFEAKPASQVKFLVEPMLSYILSYLRYCGIDTCVMPTTMLWHDVINFAISEDRFVLVAKPKNSPTVNFPQSSILSVGKISIVEQLHKVINTYNVHIQQSNILSICLYCNNNVLKTLSPDEVLKLCNEYETASSNTKYTSYVDEHEEEDYYSNFLSDSDDDVPYHQPAKPNYPNKSCKTSRGAVIEIANPQKLRALQKPAVLCETCGKLYSDDDDLLKSVREIVFKVIKL